VTEARQERADVVIVGAGVAGSVAALRLARAGFDVVCLEQGGWTDSSEFPGSKPEWELLSSRQWHPNPNVRGLPADYPCETSDSDVNPLMWSGVGGSTILYSAHWVRFLPSDFRVRSLDGIADDWPFTYDDLVPYYERVERDFAVSGAAGDPAYPAGAGPPLPPLPIGKIGRRAAAGMDRLGWHWWPGPQSIASRAHGNLRACGLRGTCLTGCPDRAKATTDLTHWPEALERGARLITGARVNAVTTDARGRASGATYIDRTGREHHQEADVVILCANGVGTPRLLQLSGLANSSGLVGKRLMMHPYAAVVGFYDEPLESWLGPTGQSIQSMQFYETDESRGFVRGGKWQVMSTGGPLGLRAAYGGAPLEERFGESLHRNVREQLGRGLEWGVIAEDLPEDSNFIALDPELTDSDGIPAPKVVYRNSDNTRRLLDFHLERLHEAQAAAGATKTVATPLMRDCGWHVLGTCKMGDDPATSVVDADGRTHEVPNLYVYDGSVFPTSAGVNPAATVAAVSLRFTERLIESAHRQAVPA
jgi:choline dehydrogenase-like flavoprotein